MKFKLTVEQDGKVIDEQETDCIVGVTHGEDELYSAICYAECDTVTMARAIKSLTEKLKELLQDPDIIAAMKVDGAEPEEITPRGGIN